MSTILTRRPGDYERNPAHKKSYAQSVSIVVGSFLIVLGLSGILNPEFMGLHLSAMHSLVLTASGILSLWSGTTNDKTRVYYTSLGLCIFFALHTLVGFLMGGPGTPSVGYDAPDELLVRIAPGFLELGTVDHVLHFLLGVFYFTGILSLNKHSRDMKSGISTRGI
jgi:hypothetical protein